MVAPSAFSGDLAATFSEALPRGDVGPEALGEFGGFAVLGLITLAGIRLTWTYALIWSATISFYNSAST